MNFLTKLTARNRTSTNEFLNSVIEIGAVQVNSQTLEEARYILGVNRSKDDYALSVLLNSIAMYPELRNEIGFDNYMAFVTWFKKSPISVSPGRIVPKINRFSATWNPTDIPESGTLRIVSKGNGAVELNIAGINYNATARFNNGTLEIDFPEDLSGLVFNVDGLASFYEGLVITIELQPHKYPFDTVIDNINNSVDCLGLLNKYGLLDSFVSIPEKPYKIALLAVAIIKEQESLL